MDECDNERQQLLIRYASLSEGRLRLVCVGPAKRLSGTPTQSPNVYLLVPLADATGDGDVLSEAFGTLPVDRLELSVRLSGGFVKLALFVGGAPSRMTDISAAELATIHDIRQFLRRFVDSETYIALQLLYSACWLGGRVPRRGRDRRGIFRRQFQGISKGRKDPT